MLEIAQGSINHLESINIDLVKFKRINTKLTKTHSTESLPSQNFTKASIKRVASSTVNSSAKSILFIYI